MEADWVLVSMVRPCQVCGGHEGCRRGFDGAFICCVRERSERPVVTGGWLHRAPSLDEAAAPPEVPTSGVRRTTRAGEPAPVSIGS